MARDRLDHLRARYEVGFALARLAEEVRAFLSSKTLIDKDKKTATHSLEAYNELQQAFDDVWSAAYVELPEDRG